MSQIVESIINYIRNKNAAFAVMINGKWGSGKTYFFNDYLKDEIEKADKNVCLIYISLFGIKTIEEIKSQILFNLITNYSNEKVFKKVKSKSDFSLWSLIRSMPNSNNIFNISSLLYSYFKKLINNGKNIVLCFDDFERTEVEIENILGCINHFIEHDSAKVIIISDESKIKDSSYKGIKEKVIGKTFIFDANIDSIVENIICKYEYNENYYKFLGSNKELIKKVYELSCTNNIRSLKIAVNEFELLYNKASEYDFDSTYFKLMLRLYMALMYEIKKGELDLNILRNDKYVYFEKDNEKTEDADDFIRKYFLDPYTFNRCSFRFIINYIFDGYLNEELMETELTNIIKKDMPYYIKLMQIGWYNMEDDDFNQVIDGVLNEIKLGEVQLISFYSVCVILLELKSKGLISLDIDYIIMEGLNKIEDNINILEPNIKNNLLNHMNVYNLNIEPENQERLSLIHTKVIEINKKIIEYHNNENIKTDFIRLSNNQVSIYEFFEKYSQKSIFNIIDINNFLLLVNKLSNTQLNSLFIVLDDRYKSIDNNLVYCELDNLKILMDSLELKQNKNVRNYHLENIKTMINNILYKNK